MFGLFKVCSVRLAIKYLPICRTNCAAGDNAHRCGNLSLRQPSCSGHPAVSLSPFVRRDVRVAELQVVRTVEEWCG